jgi:hypothetical protein
MENKLLTVTADSHYKLVKNPKIKRLRDTLTGKKYSLDDSRSLPRTERDVLMLRNMLFDAVVEKKITLVCDECGGAVYPKIYIKKREYEFVHVNHDQHDCPCNGSEERLDKEQIMRKKFKKKKKGPVHIKITTIVYKSMCCDPNFDKARTAVEKYWRSKHERKGRWPDVQSFWKKNDSSELPVICEVQLSYLGHLDTSGRKFFYRDEKAILLWIYGDSRPDFTMQFKRDLFVDNNCNAFIVNDETQKESKTRNKFVLLCSYFEPILVDHTIQNVLHKKLVTFDELIIDQDKQQIYYFDYAGALSELNKKNK